MTEEGSRGTWANAPAHGTQWRLLLAAVAAVFVSLLGAGTASASAPYVAETRVRASTVAMAHVLGIHECIVAGQRWGNAPPQIKPAAGFCVAAESAGASEDLALSCANSFTADTPVTMADSNEKLIKDVEVGDVVLATDSQTSETRPEPVVAVIRHTGQHAMVLVRLADGSVLDVTRGHKIWDASQDAFVDAGQLRVEDSIETSHGRLIMISALTRYIADLTAYNLQIDKIHTYYAGNTPVLVHNSCTSIISDDSFLVKAAEKAGSNSSVQREIDSLTAQLSAGNLNPGIATKALVGTGLSYARGENGARILFRIADGGVQMVAKASKANESGVIARLQDMYGN